MSELTIDLIEAKQTELAELIASFKKKSELESAFPINVLFPKLNFGEIYVGSIITAEKREHIILLPGDNDDAEWGYQIEWAASIGGRLPSRYEQALLFANMRDQFQKAAYWSGEAHASHSYHAWYQYFATGYQLSLTKHHELRARAVRSEAF